MRTAAVGWFATDETAATNLAAAQAAVSHDHPDAIAAAQAVAPAIFLLRQGASPAVVRMRLADDFGYELRSESALASSGFDVSAAGTVPAALAAAFEAENWENAVRTVIGLGGDTDTLACIAGAVAEVIHGVPDDIAMAARSRLTIDLASVLEGFEAATGRRSRLKLSGGTG